MTPDELHRALRTVIARLELLSSAPTQRLDRDGGGDGDGGGIAAITTPADRYRGRLRDIDGGLRRRLDASEATGDTGERRAEQRKAWTWHHNARESVLTDATRELAQLTGRDGEAPERHGGELDTAKGIAKAIAEEAPGKPAEEVAAKLGLSKFIVRRRYAELGLYPVDGTPIVDKSKPSEESLLVRARDMKARGLTQKQIATNLGCDQGTVSRLLRRVAA